MKAPCSLTVILLFPLLVNAYTWQFTSQPIQCSTVSIAIQGSGGQPPYSLLILPTGASPLPGHVEVRPILNIPFSGTSTTLSFTLNYPQDSSFVAVVRSYLSRHIFPISSSCCLQVSDKSGYGTGGASTSTTVLRSSDSSCYSTSKPWNPTWYFSIDPPGGLTQCESVRNWWEAIYVDGCVSPSIFPNSARLNSLHQSGSSRRVHLKNRHFLRHHPRRHSPGLHHPSRFTFY